MSNPNVLASADLLMQVQVNTAQLTKEATKAAKQFDRAFQQTQRQFKSQALANQVKAVQGLSGAFGGLGSQLRLVNPQISGFQRAVSAANSFTTKFSGVLIGAAAGTAALTAAVVGLGASFAKTAGDFQALEQSINAIIDNSETAKTTTDAFIGSLRDLALRSGRSSEILANTGRQFLALGFSGEHTVEVLTAFTKAASLTGATNQQLQLALNGVSQIASKGAVSMEELRRQIAENLPGAVSLTKFFEFLGEEMGVSTEQARKLQEQGLAPAAEGIRALVSTVNDATEGIDVFALRAKTLSGLIGIMKEGFAQAVQDGFRPFIDAVVGAEGGPLGAFIKSLKTGGSAVSGLQELLERFGKVLGTSFVDILNEVVPLIPMLANLFVTLTEALAPVVVDLVKTGATILKILLPALNGAALVLRFLFTELGPVSFILRQLATGGIIAGVAKGFGIFGKAVGALGPAMSRLTGPLTSAFTSLASMAGVLGIVTSAFGVLRPAISAFVGAVGPLVTGLLVATVAFKAFNVQSRIAAGMTSLNAAIGLRSAAFQSFASIIGRTTIAIRSAVSSMTLLRGAMLGIGIGAAAVAVGGLVVAYKRAEKQAESTYAAISKDIDTSNLVHLEIALQRVQDKLPELEKRSEGWMAKIARNIFGTNDQIPWISDWSDALIGDNELDGVRSLGDEFKTQGVLIEGIFNSVKNATGATFAEIRDMAGQLGIDLTNIVPEQELSIIDRLKAKFVELNPAAEKVGKTLEDVTKNIDALFSAAKSLESAQEGLAAANRALGDATRDLQKANEDLEEANIDLVELEQERQEVLSDTAADLREIADAEDDLTRIGYRLRDIEQDRLGILQDIADLKAPATAEELARADLKVEKATNALNKAKQKEQELLDALTKKEIRRSINLRGLSLDQLRTTLANTRAGLDASKRQEEELNPDGKTPAEIQAELIDARIEVKEAELDVNEAVTERLALDNKVLENADKIREKEEDLLDLELDKKDALRDQVTAQTALNLLLAGTTTQSTIIKGLDEQIATAKERQKDATEKVRDANVAIGLAQIGIRDANNEIKIATIERQIAEAKITGDLGRQLTLEQQLTGEKASQLGFSRALIDDLQIQQGLLAAQAGIAQGVHGLQLLTVDQMTQLLRQPAPANGSEAEMAIRQLANAIFTTPEWSRASGNLLNSTRALAEGGLVTRPTMAMTGEGYKHELMLPLSKPDRVWQLLSQNLPKYPGALRAAQAALGGPGPSPALANAVSSLRSTGGPNGGVSHFERDLLTELRMMNEQLDKLSKQDPNVSVSVAQKSNDELLRKQILRDVSRMLAERRR